MQRIHTQLEMVNITVQIQSSLVSSTKMKRDALSEKILTLKEQIRKKKQEIQHILLHPEEFDSNQAKEQKSILESLYEEKKQCHSEMEAVKAEYAAAWEKLKSVWAEQEELRKKESDRTLRLTEIRKAEQKNSIGI